MNQLIIAAAILTSIFAATNAYNFNVNWVQNPKESLNAWSSRLRFQINDNLAFKSDQADSVLVVQKQDFDSCNIGNPIQKLGANSNFQLTRPGPYYFISGDAQKCAKGQKMMVVVLSPRTKKQPVAAPPMISPVPSLTSPSMSPSSTSTPPSSSSPSTAPLTAPSSSSLAPSSSSLAPSSLAPIPFSGETTPGPAGGEGPALAPVATSAGSTLGVTIMMAAVVIVGNVLLG